MMRIHILAVAGLLVLSPALAGAQAAPPDEKPADPPAAEAAPESEAAPAEEAPPPGQLPESAEAPPPSDMPPAEEAPAAEAPEAAAPADSAPNVGDAGADLSGYGVSDDAVPPGGRMDWAKRRQIRVIQKRAMLKEDRHQFTLMGGIVPNDDFFAYIAMGLAYNYYFSEAFSLDISAAYTLDQKTSLEGSLEEGRPEGPSLLVRLPQTLESYAAVAVIWNLLHGKLGFFDTRLSEFDFGLVFGLGANTTIIQGKGESQVLRKIDANGNVGACGLFYMSDNWALRVDYRQFFYPKEGGGVSFPISATLGLSYFTDAPE